MVIEDPKRSHTFNAWQSKEGKVSDRIAMASPLDRLAAAVLDIFVVLGPIIGLLAAPFKQNIDESILLGDDLGLYVNMLAVLVLVVGTVVAYFGVFHFYLGASLGKLFFGLRVIDIWSRKYPTLGKSLLRSLTWAGEWFLLGLPNLTVMSNAKRRSIHDRMADTVVVSLRNSDVKRPSIVEASFVRGVYSALIFLAFLIVMAKASQLYLEVKNFNRLSNFLESEDLLCREVGVALEEWPEENNQRAERLSVAMGLYAAGTIDETCLQSEVDSVFRADDSNAMAYLANSFVYSEKPQLSNDYLKMVCDVEPSSDTCRMSHIIELWTEDKWDDVEVEFDSMADASSIYIYIWGIRHFVNRHRFDKAMALIDRVSPSLALSSFLSSYRTKAYWGLKKFEEARAAAQVAYNNLEPLDQLDLASWICFESTSLGCSQLEESSCRVMNKYLKENNEFLLDPRMAIAHFREKECGDEKVDYGELASAMILPEAQQLADAQDLIEIGDLKKGIHLLKEIVENESYDSYFQAEALRRQIRYTSELADIDKYLLLWQGEDESLEWEKTGWVLFQKYYELKKYVQSFAIGKRLWPFRNYDKVFKRNMITAGYRAGLRTEAWQFLKNINGDKNDVEVRNPASLQEFETVSKMLRKEHGDL